MSGRALEAGEARVVGRVQGVGFRAATVDAARRLGVAGSVRNLADGSVEVVAEGSAEALAGLRAFLARGPRFARVDRLDWTPRAPRGLKEFVVASERPEETGRD